MLEQLKQEVCAANLKLVEYGLVVLTWGNVSTVTEDRKYVVIKPSGVDYAAMAPAQMVVVDMEGNVVEGELRPSSDLPTHLELYRAFPAVKSVVHTHSRYATAMAQAERSLPCYGTTHADTFYGEVPCTRHLTAETLPHVRTTSPYSTSFRLAAQTSCFNSSSIVYPPSRVVQRTCRRGEPGYRRPGQRLPRPFVKPRQTQPLMELSVSCCRRWPTGRSSAPGWRPCWR